MIEKKRKVRSKKDENQEAEVTPANANERDEKAGGHVRHRRIFILDTNVLLHDSMSLFAFKGVVVGIPLIVLEELDQFKKENNELGRNARQVIRTLDELRSQGSLADGVPLNHGTSSALLKIFYSPEHLHAESLCVNSADNQIISILQHLADQGNKVTFITKDINARVKADALKIQAEDYLKGTVSVEEYYKGWIRLPVSAVDLKALSPEKVKVLVAERRLLPNEYVVFYSEKNPEHVRLFRHVGKESYKAVVQPQLLGDFAARNVEQLMALDVLMDDDIRLVILMGPAGTGKTFLALLVGLYKVVKQRSYRKLLVSRPVVALGADVGYLPGELKDKLRNWMMPIYDNLEFIFSQLKDFEAKDHEAKSFTENANDRRRHKRHPHENGNNGTVDHVERLERKGVLSLEAITYMRGRSIPNQFVFIDEVQNLTPHEVKTIVSRAGQGTKVVLAGDPHQIDSPFLDFTSNGLTVTSEKLKEEQLCGSVYLEISERSELSHIAATLL